MSDSSDIWVNGEFVDPYRHIRELETENARLKCDGEFVEKGLVKALRERDEARAASAAMRECLSDLTAPCWEDKRARVLSLTAGSELTIMSQKNPKEIRQDGFLYIDPGKAVSQNRDLIRRLVGPANSPKVPAPSAPRLYRNACLEEAANACEECRACECGAMFCGPCACAEAIRALKSSESEDGT